MTSCMSSMRSNQLSYTPVTRLFYHKFSQKAIGNIAQCVCFLFVQGATDGAVFGCFREKGDSILSDSRL